MDDSQKKLKIGWFSFTCCEDSTMMFIELLNEHFFEWKKVLDFKHAKVFQTKNVLDDLDVAFVEGAITNKKDEEKLKKIRDVSKKLVAIGACACTGQPSGMRNQFDESLQDEIKPILDAFKYSEKVYKLDELVQVDYAVPGCPMDTKKFTELINQLLREFHIQ